MSEHFLTYINIEEFKCFKNFEASGFKRVNLIGGKNNIGKTAFMEAVYINVFGESFSHLISGLSCFKYMRENVNLVGKLFNEDIEKKFLNSIKSYNSVSNIHKKSFSINESDLKIEHILNINDNSISINIADIDIKKYFNDAILFIDNFGITDEQLIVIYQVIQVEDRENELNHYIREFDDSIENFKVIGDKPQCKTNGEYRDITEFGDGLKHYISIICALYACENGYLFIDEIDNGIYYEHFDRLWEIILTLSKQTNCQVFATTHSKEMLESFARVAKKLDEQDVSYTRLVKNKKQELKSTTFNYEVLEYSFENAHEVR